MNVLMVMDWGWSEMLWVSLISICLVFLVLWLLVFVMKGFGAAFSRRNALNPASAPAQLHDEEIAAIASALKIFRIELHDLES